MAFRSEDQPDAIAALRAYLAAELSVPVYALHLPRTPNNPRECVLLSPASGDDPQVWERIEVDGVCYGKDYSEAGRVRV